MKKVKRIILIFIALFLISYITLNIVAISNDNIFSSLYKRPLGKYLLFISLEYDNVHLTSDTDKVCAKVEDLRWNAFKKNDITPRTLNAPIEQNMDKLRWGIEGYEEGEARGEDWTEVLKDYREALEQAEPIYNEYLELKKECEDLSNRVNYRYQQNNR